MPETPVTPTQDQVKHKITVDGQEIEVTQDELIKLAQMGKDYTKKTQILAEQEKTLKAEQEKVAGMKSIVDEMDADPQLKEILNKVYSDYKSGKVSKSENIKDRDLKKLDKLIEDSSDPAQREQLKDIREIIREEAPIEEIKETVKSLRDELSIIKNAAIIGQSERVENQLLKLEEEFGAELVGKYKKDIQAMAVKYPAQSVTKLLFHFADNSEIKTALLNQAKKMEKEELEKKKRSSIPGGSESSFAAKTALEKDRAGRITHTSILQRIKERLGKA